MPQKGRLYFFYDKKMTTDMIHLDTQIEFRPVLPEIFGHAEFKERKAEIERMEVFIEVSGIENEFVNKCLEQWLKEAKKTPSVKAMRRFEMDSRKAMRCMVLQEFLGLSFREMSIRLAESSLYQKFCLLDRIDQICIPSKSVLHRYHQWIGVETLVTMNQNLLASVCSGEEEIEVQINLKSPIEMGNVWIDSTVVKANIHFPVDWVLLVDAVRTLMKATTLIRREGLKIRMNDPEVFRSRMNKLAMAMTAVRRKKDSKKKRKQVLRAMKELTKTVRNHALRHRDLLDSQWEKTQLGRGEVEQILTRIDSIISQLPDAIDQAHKRIISETQVENSKKILSLYEEDVHVIVRGKANAEVEFGNSLLIVEQGDGLIVDWKLHQDKAPNDAKQLIDSITRIRENYGEESVRGVCGDRGFDSQQNSQWLEEHGIYNGNCPRNPKELEKKKCSAKFKKVQKRRAQTEARIAILKNRFIGKPLLQKGFKNRKLATGWAILTHNLWVLARMEQCDEEEKQLPKAA